MTLLSQSFSLEYYLNSSTLVSLPMKREKMKLTISPTSFTELLVDKNARSVLETKLCNNYLHDKNKAFKSFVICL